METYIDIPTTDEFIISGVLNSQGQTSRLVIFVHGLTGGRNEAHYYAGKEYFTKGGFDVFRFNLYSGGKNKRQLHETNIKEHSIDIQKVLQHFQDVYKELYLVGHSLAGPSIVGMESFPDNLKKIIFWDPAFDTASTILRCFEKNGVWLFYPKNGKNVEISKDMYDEFVTNRHLEDLKHLNFSYKNTAIIFAGDCDKIDFKSQTDALGIESYIVEGANHGFTQEGKYEELFDKTLEYINK